ncbi:MAG: ribosome silencing factor [Atopobiaceae bacterium]|nr:ribosome silencing factor [Atopobiaceae bacterium]
MTVTSLELAKVAAIAADQKKAEDILVLDLTELSDVCDYFVICTGSNARLADAIVDEVREKVRTNCELKPLSTEGRDGLNWILIDYGSVVVHVFQPETRAYYRLERLWADAPRIAMNLEGEMTSEIPYVDLPEDALAPAFEVSDDDLVGNLPNSENPIE